jgi:hypothetical protein
MSLLAAAVENSKGMSLDKTMRDIRIWLDGERIEPVQFKTVVGRAGSTDDLLECRLLHDARGHRRHDDLALPVLLAGRTRSRGREDQAGAPTVSPPRLASADRVQKNPGRYCDRHGLSNLIAISIIITTAATLHAHGVTNIQSSSQAAEALRPIAGSFAALIFTAGIVGTGLLAVPVLAGSAAYAVSEAAGWPVGLARPPRNAVAFYLTLALAMLIGIGLNFTSINPISALYWSAVVNGVAAVPIMVLMMIMTARSRVMGEFTIGYGLKTLGWAATVAMVACVIGMAVTAFI